MTTISLYATAAILLTALALIGWQVLRSWMKYNREKRFYLETRKPKLRKPELAGRNFKVVWGTRREYISKHLTQWLTQ